MKTRFDELMNRLSPTLRRIAHKMNGHRTYFSDDDLAQEAMIHLWNSYREGSIDDKTDSYLLQGAYFHLKNYLRTHLDKVRPESMDAVMTDGETEFGETIAAETALPSDAIDGEELLDKARSGGLDSREMRVLMLFMDGFTTREIGSRLGISHVMVVKIRKRIRAKCAGIWLPKRRHSYL